MMLSPFPDMYDDPAEDDRNNDDHRGSEIRFTQIIPFLPDRYYRKMKQKNIHAQFSEFSPDHCSVMIQEAADGPDIIDTVKEKE